MRILWFNWRDIKHPQAGGAEVLTHEVMKRLVRLGYDMTLFCSDVSSRPSVEEIDGVKIVRKGGKYTVYRNGRKYFKKHKERYDFIIDEINPRPFLNPRILGRTPVLVLFHQLIREEWFYEMPFPLSYLCYYYENRWLTPYKNTPTLTVSRSSKCDLEKIGFKQVKVIPMGVNVMPLKKIGKKEDSPTVVFIGRFKRHKLPHHAIEAFLILKKDIPSAKMWLIGDGYMRKTLEKTKNKDITFFGHLENQKKYDLLSRAHVVLVPSVREGWGLVVVEANAMGTPVVAYNVNGLRDSTIDGRNGILVKENNPTSLARAALGLFADDKLSLRLSSDALEYSRQFSWDKTTEFFVREIERAS